MPDRNVESKEDLLKRAGEDLTEIFKEARLAYLQEEASTGQRSIQNLANFRDASSHLILFLTYLNDGDCKQAEEELNNVEEHLHRIIYESSKRPVENHIDYISRNKLPSTLYTITLVDGPDQEDFYRRLNSVKKLYLKGREQRNAEILEEAAEEATSLREEIPSKKEVYFRLLIILGAFVSSFITFVNIL